MNRYCYNAETEDLNEWLTAAHKLRNEIDEGTRGAVDVHEKKLVCPKESALPLDRHTVKPGCCLCNHGKS